jgi:type III pantothenate kinase
MTAVLQIDAGNSSAKWRLVAGGEVVERGRLALDADETPAALADAVRAASEIWLASVLDDTREAALEQRLTQLNPIPLRRARSERRCAGVENSYQDPTRMGVDRWLALLAARRRVDGRVCVVDAGSALTIDLLAADGRHEGSYIIPGRDLIRHSLLSGTGRVRDADGDPWSLEPGTNTGSAVSSGAALALVGAVREALRQAGSPRPVVIFCGGSGEHLLKLLDADGIAAPDLVFEGLELSIVG